VFPSSIRVYTIIALALFVALAAAVSTGHTAALDQSIRLAVHAHSSPALTAAFRFLTLFGETGVLLGLSVAATAVLAALRWKQAALWFAVSMLGAYALDMALKNSFHRPRPPVSFFATPMPNSFSFPSGHALFSVCWFGTLALLIAPRLRPRAARIALWSGAAPLAFAIGCSRIYLGVHYPTDVLAGFAAGVVWLGALAVFLREC
jgi:undecaprenyl-diphosphatase